jgi:hypothetical protein
MDLLHNRIGDLANDNTSLVMVISHCCLLSLPAHAFEIVDYSDVGLPAHHLAACGTPDLARFERDMDHDPRALPFRCSAVALTSCG